MRGWAAAVVVCGACGSPSGSATTADGGAPAAPDAAAPDAAAPDAGACAPALVVAPRLTRCARPWFAGEISPAVEEMQWGYESRMAVADLDGDGRPDVVAPGGGNQLALLLGAGNGSFAAPILLDVNFYATQIAIGDLDGDGAPDIVSFDRKAYGPGDVDILLNRGGGAFAPPVTFQAGDDPLSIAMGDLDGDRDLDLVVANAALDHGSVTVLYNDGTAGFTRQETYPTEPAHGSAYAAAADVDGDGRLDIVAANGEPTISVLLGRAGGGFSAPITISLSTRAVSLTLADLNGDRAPDLVLALPFEDGGSVGTLLNLGGGRFGPPVAHSMGPDVNQVAVADLDGDGDADLVAAQNGWVGFPNVLINDGAGGFSGRDLDGVGGAHSVALADLDADGVPDIVLQYGGTIRAFLSDGHGGLAGIERLSPPSENALFVRDLDGDGRLDLLGSFGLMLRNGDGSFAAPRPVPAGAEHQLDDLDGDGVLDLVVTRDGVVEVWRGSRDARFTLWDSHTEDALLGNIATGDLDGDCRRDVVVGAFDPNAPALPVPVFSLLVLRNAGPGSFAASSIANAPRAVRLADFNNDGYDDLVGVVGKFGAPVLALGRGDGTFDAPTLLGGGGSGAIADFNADGNLDLSGGAGVILGNGDGTFGLTIRTSFGSITGDIDGDGNLDLAGDGIALGHGDGTFTSLGRYWPMQGGLEIADVDGDGLSDLVTQGGLLLRQICRP